MHMRPLYKILLLLLLSTAIETSFYLYYKQAATGYLAEPITEHTAALESGTIPPADEIDLANDPWVKVAHFESAFYQVTFAVDTIMSLAIAWLLIFGGVSAAIARWARQLTPNIHFFRALYLAGFTAIFALLGLPLYLSSFAIAALRGTSLQTFDAIPFYFLQDLVVGAIFAILTFVPFYWIMDRYRKWWWAIGAVFFTLFSVFTAYIGPYVIDPLYVDARPMEEGPTKQELLSIAERANVEVGNQLFVSHISDVSYESNAMVTGLGNTKRIVIDDTMLAFYTPDEIGFILAHELGHYTRGDIWKSLAGTAVLNLMSFAMLAVIFTWIVRRYGARVGARHVNDIVLYPLIGTLLTFLSFATAPVTSYLSRADERAADAFALQLTGDAQAGIDGFTKNAYQGFIDPNPPELLQWWFGTHPTMQERIDTLRDQ